MNNLINAINTKNIVIPSYALKLYKKLDISLLELVFIYYLSTIDSKVIFDVNKFQKDLNIDMQEIMMMVSNLTDKKLITMSVLKNDKGIMEEYLEIDNFFNKICSCMLNEKEISNNSNIYLIIEKEFGRTLSPIEYETIKKWIDSNISEELIKEALKEAVLNGVSNLKYIDKILYEWNKKGYKQSKDIVRKENKSNEIVEIFDYDWLEDE